MTANNKLGQIFGTSFLFEPFTIIFSLFCNEKQVMMTIDRSEFGLETVSQKLQPFTPFGKKENLGFGDRMKSFT